MHVCHILLFSDELSDHEAAALHLHPLQRAAARGVGAKSSPALLSSHGKTAPVERYGMHQPYDTMTVFRRNNAL